MGDQFRKGFAEAFKKGRDRAKRLVAEPRLIERPEVSTTVYSVQTDDGKECRKGEDLRVLLPDPSGPVVVARGWERVGVIDGEGGNVLKRALAEHSGPGIAEVRILSVSDISGEATAEIVGAVSR